jgi:cyclophilin family peptidyl-prolyl cis-trans isomerase
MKYVLIILLIFIGGCQMTNQTATIETTLGTMKIELYNDKAPITVENFVKLANDGFYDGVIFHRVIENFMVQSGDPKGTGTGGPGYTIKDEFHPSLKHSSAGILSMANTGMPNSGGSQFFITLVPTPWLDNKHSVFGKVIEGEEVLKAIGNTAVDRNDRPLKEIKIIKVTIN